MGYVRALVFRADGSPKEARQWLVRSLRNEPTLRVAHWELVGLDNEERNFGAVADRLLRLRDAFKEDVTAWKTEPAYAEFRASPETARLR